MYRIRLLCRLHGNSDYQFITKSYQFQSGYIRFILDVDRPIILYSIIHVNLRFIVHHSTWNEHSMSVKADSELQMPSKNKPKMAYSRDLPKMAVWHYGIKLQWYLTGDRDWRYGMVWYG